MENVQIINRLDDKVNDALLNNKKSFNDNIYVQS